MNIFLALRFLKLLLAILSLAAYGSNFPSKLKDLKKLSGDRPLVAEFARNLSTARF
ncbi:MULTISPECIES: hypothetical protein [Microcoleaceae]|uniref:hypothetical protein n=1 Tax=Microcoleaceae TaxID=1892252 RepID=UPI001882404B|nr:hypothetical protein [Tychonema sp. LEGE 06208]MBE9164624.1 hypothetical protein [Tychonema sp. LEGE 06208]